MNTKPRCDGTLGDPVIRMLVPSKAALVIPISINAVVEFRMLLFERVWWTGVKIEPGAMPFTAVTRHFWTTYDNTGSSKLNEQTDVAAYRCTQCRTMFIVPRIKDLHHECTEPFEGSN